MVTISRYDQDGHYVPEKDFLSVSFRKLTIGPRTVVWLDDNGEFIPDVWKTLEEHKQTTGPFVNKTFPKLIQYEAVRPAMNHFSRLNRKKYPKFIFVDLRFPEENIDGMDFVKYIRSKNFYSVIIFISMFETKGIASQYTRLGSKIDAALVGADAWFDKQVFCKPEFPQLFLSVLNRASKRRENQIATTVASCKEAIKAIAGEAQFDRLLSELAEGTTGKRKSIRDVDHSLIEYFNLGGANISSEEIVSRVQDGLNVKTRSGVVVDEPLRNSTRLPENLSDKRLKTTNHRHLMQLLKESSSGAANEEEFCRALNDLALASHPRTIAFHAIDFLTDLYNDHEFERGFRAVLLLQAWAKQADPVSLAIFGVFGGKFAVREGLYTKAKEFIDQSIILADTHNLPNVLRDALRLREEIVQ